MDKAGLLVILYMVTFVSIVAAVHYWFRSRQHWKQMQNQKQWMDNTLYHKNGQISESKMQVDNARADVIKLCGLIETKNAEIEELVLKLAKYGHFVAKGA